MSSDVMTNDVARAIDGVIGADWRDLDQEQCSRDVAAAAIVAATPHIRADTLDGLLQYVESLKGTLPPVPLMLAKKIIAEYANTAK